MPFYTQNIIQLPKQLKGVIKFFVLIHPENQEVYTIGIHDVYQTKGAEQYLHAYEKGMDHRKRKSIHAHICSCVFLDSIYCLSDVDCLDIHIQLDSIHNLRLWKRYL